MLVDMNGIIYSLSYALDCIEAEFVGVVRDHAKYVAYLSTLIGKAYGLDAAALSDLSSCAALHDNALTQYLADESGYGGQNVQSFHCSAGEENVRDFPFHGCTAGFILYHHENADGSGPFGKSAEETPLQAQIIHLADLLDATCRFHEISPETYDRIERYLTLERDKLYSADLIDHFWRAMPREKYLSLTGRTIDELLDEALPHQLAEYPFEQVRAVMDVFGRIVDYKSTFTRNHSEQIAQRAYRMAEFYGYDRSTAERLYIAGALHDIGKMAITNDVLEKPGKLTDTEFDLMQNHAWYTHLLLGKIAGFEDIAQWAGHHHEKLNGKGYPFGKTAEELGEKERLLACVDIYQALREDRPYKAGFRHEKAMEIMYGMSDNGFIDARITKDLDRVFAGS